MTITCQECVEQDIEKPGVSIYARDQMVLINRLLAWKDTLDRHAAL